jgi:hypothetical protein
MLFDIVEVFAAIRAAASKIINHSRLPPVSRHLDYYKWGGGVCNERQ